MTDKELAKLLPTLPLEKRLEAIIAKYVGGAMSSHYDGDTPGPEADRRIAKSLMAKIKPWLTQDQGPIRAEIEKLPTFDSYGGRFRCEAVFYRISDVLEIFDKFARLERADVPPLATHLPTGESCSHTQPPESVKDVENPRVASRLPETATGTLPAGVRQTPRIDGNHHSVRAFARDIDFAVDVTEPREVLLGRFEDVLMRLRWQTVRETIDSLERAGWLNSDDAAGVRATLSAAVPRSIPFTRAPVPGPNRAEGDRRDAATPPADRHKALIDARNDIMAAIVKLRGGYAVKMDACDEAVAALDIAIGLAFSTSADPRVVPR